MKRIAVVALALFIAVTASAGDMKHPSFPPGVHTGDPCIVNQPGGCPGVLPDPLFVNAIRGKGTNPTILGFTIAGILHWFGWGGSEIGAQINAAWASAVCPAAGCTVDMRDYVSGTPWTTPIVFGGTGVRKTVHLIPNGDLTYTGPILAAPISSGSSSCNAGVCTATITTSGNHPYATGMSVHIKGAIPQQYNAVATITKTGNTTFTYIADEGGSSPGAITMTTAVTGTMTAGLNKLTLSAQITGLTLGSILSVAGAGPAGAALTVQIMAATNSTFTTKAGDGTSRYWYVDKLAGTTVAGAALTPAPVTEAGAIQLSDGTQGSRIECPQGMTSGLGQAGVPPTGNRCAIVALPTSGSGSMPIVSMGNGVLGGGATDEVIDGVTFVGNQNIDDGIVDGLGSNGVFIRHNEFASTGAQACWNSANYGPGCMAPNQFCTSAGFMGVGNAAACCTGSGTGTCNPPTGAAVHMVGGVADLSTVEDNSVSGWATGFWNDALNYSTPRQDFGPRYLNNQAMLISGMFYIRASGSFDLDFRHNSIFGSGIMPGGNTYWADSPYGEMVMQLNHDESQWIYTSNVASFAVIGGGSQTGSISLNTIHSSYDGDPRHFQTEGIYVDGGSPGFEIGRNSILDNFIAGGVYCNPTSNTGCSNVWEHDNYWHNPVSGQGNVYLALTAASESGNTATYTADWVASNSATCTASLTPFQNCTGNAAFAYAAGVWGILPTSNNAGNYVYYQYGACTPGTSRPTFNQTVGTSTADGTCSWFNMGNTLAVGENVATAGITAAGYNTTACMLNAVGNTLSCPIAASGLGAGTVFGILEPYSEVVAGSGGFFSRVLGGIEIDQPSTTSGAQANVILNAKSINQAWSMTVPNASALGLGAGDFGIYDNRLGKLDLQIGESSGGIAIPFGFSTNYIIGTGTPGIAGGGGLQANSTSLSGVVTNIAATGNVLTTGATCAHVVVLHLTAPHLAWQTAGNTTTGTFSGTAADNVNYWVSCN